MSARKPTRWWLLVVIGVIFSAGAAEADFNLIEDFESIPLGSVDGQNGWFAPADSSVVAEDPDIAGNQVLSVVTESTILRKDLLILNGTIRMVFFRFRFDQQLNYSMGMSDFVGPSRFDHFEVELSQTNATNELRINDGGTYEVLTILAPGIWYNCWLLIDNESDKTQIWLHARPKQAATEEDLLASEEEKAFVFRNISAADLRTFFIKTGGGNGQQGPLYIDDIYLENTGSLNLDYPAAAVTSVLTPEVSRPYILAPNYPNPFNPATTIAFDLPNAEMVELMVHALDGCLVSTLVNEMMSAGRHEIIWDGCDRQGRPVASGTYLYRMSAGQYHDTKSMTLMK